MKISVIGDGDGTRAEFLGAQGERLYLDCAIQETEIGVKMEVDKVFFVHYFFFSVSEPVFLGAGGLGSTRCPTVERPASRMLPVLRERSLAQPALRCIQQLVGALIGSTTYWLHRLILVD